MNEPAVRAGALRLCVLAPLPFLVDGVRTFANTGGPVFYEELLPRLAERGHHVLLLAEAPPAAAGENRSGLDWRHPRLSVEWFELEYRTGSVAPPPGYAKAMRERLRPRLERLTREERPDLVLIGRETLCNFAPQLCREFGLPSLLIAHGSPTFGLLDGIYPQAAATDLVEGMRGVDEIVAVGPHLASILCELGMERVCSIANFVDPERFRPMPRDAALLRRLAIGPQQPVVGHLSSLRPRKRALDVVRSAELVLERHPDVIYLIMGEGPCSEALQERVSQRGLRAGFRFTGLVSREDVPRYLNLCDVFVMTTEREGGFPLVCREAQACGRPVLMSDIPTAREGIVGEEDAVLFALGDPAALAVRTERLLLDAALRRRIGAAARVSALSGSAQRWVGKYEEVLQRAARGSSRQDHLGDDHA